MIWFGFFLLVLVPATVLAADEGDFTLHKVGDGVWAAIGRDASKAGANAGFVIGDNGVAVIDTFEDPAAARELLAEIRKLTNLPIRYVVNTHYHLDHVNGNDVFAQAGATIVAQRNVRGWERTENLKWWGDKIKPEIKARVQSLALPDVVYEDALDLYLGTRKLEVRYYPGHTGGDSVVYVPDAHVIFCGDLLWNHHLPNLIDASTQPWIQTLDAFQKNYAGSTLIPGHGEVAHDADLAAFREYLMDLRKNVEQALAAGKSGDALVDAVLPELQSKYGSWGFFKAFSRSNITQTGEELAGKKRVPPIEKNQAE